MGLLVILFSVMPSDEGRKVKMLLAILFRGRSWRLHARRTTFS